jgi:hypothetical protein
VWIFKGEVFDPADAGQSEPEGGKKAIA